MTYITRTFTRTRISVAGVEIENGKSVMSPPFTLILDGEVDKVKALKIAKKEDNGKHENLIITSLEVVTELRGMPVSEFLTNSIVMDDPRTPATPV